MIHVRTAALAIVAATALTLTGCANYSAQPAATASGAQGEGTVSLIKPGTLLACTHLSYKPFEFKEGDKVVGFDVDLIDLVAKKVDATTEIVDIDFNSMTSGAVFAARKCDIAFGAVTINDKRKQSILFSDPYFKATQALITTKGDIKTLADLKGKKLGVQTDTTGQVYGNENAAAHGYETVVFEDMPSQLAAMLAGTVDAAVNDNGVVYDYAKENTQAKVVAEFDTNEEYGFMVAKDNANATALNEAVNEVLATAKSDGTYNTIYKKWFNTDAPQ